MTLDEYLKEKKLYSVDSYESNDLIEMFLDLSKHILGFEIKVIQIKSNNIHPHVVKLDEGYFLMWDLYYWELFDNFVMQLAACLNGNQVEIIEKNIKLLVFDYLINRFSHIPALALCIQASRKKIGDDLLKKSNVVYVKNEHFERFISGHYWGIGAQARYAVFFHEIFHVYYNIHLEVKREDIKRLQILANTYLEQNPQYFVRGENLSDKLKEGLYELFEDTMFTEEMAVDYRALIEMLSIYRRIDGDKFSSLEHIKMIHEAFKINEVFLCYLVNIESSWKILFKNYQRANTYDELLQRVMPELDETMRSALARNTVIPDFLEKLSAIKYGVEDFENILWNKDIINLIDKSAQQFESLNFIFYAIEEGLRIINDDAYDPYEARDILFHRMRDYFVE